jgi:hypothetical protein
MDIRYLKDPDGELHISAHGVSEVEVAAVLSRPVETIHGRDGAMLATGQTQAGRWIRVVYIVEEDESVFIITAFDVPPKQVRALKRRRRDR